MLRDLDRRGAGVRTRVDHTRAEIPRGRAPALSRALVAAIDITVVAIPGLVGAPWCLPNRPTYCSSTSPPRSWDVTHQIEVFDLLTDLNRSRRTTIAMVLHDLNLAARYADHLVTVSAGEVDAAGDPAEVLTADRVHTVFGLRSRVILDPISNKPLVLPIGRHHCYASSLTAVLPQR